MRRGLAALIAVSALAIGFLLTKGPPPPGSALPGTFSFAAFGDAPYYPWEALRYRVLLADLAQHDLSVAINIGDILWKPCSDERYRKALDEFNAIPHPVVYTPGDNEWTDCWQRAPGGYRPLERLARLRRMFYSSPAMSLGADRVSLETQGGEFVENVRWTHAGVTFTTIHVVGSWNATRSFPARTPADDHEVIRRNAANLTWLRETFARAHGPVVIAFHASPGFEHPPGHEYRRAFESILTALQEESRRYGGPVLIVHGDDHEFIVDHPFGGLPNVVRMEVPGSPDVGWVRVTVNPAATMPFTFERRLVPKWKYW